jgi:hypothetical protein
MISMAKSTPLGIKKGLTPSVNPFISGGSDPVKLNGTTFPTYCRDVLTNTNAINKVTSPPPPPSPHEGEGRVGGNINYYVCINSSI